MTEALSLTTLPPEVLTEVFDRLGYRDLRRVGNASRLCRSIVTELFKKFLQNFPGSGWRGGADDELWRYATRMGPLLHAAFTISLSAHPNALCLWFKRSQPHPIPPFYMRILGNVAHKGMSFPLGWLKRLNQLLDGKKQGTLALRLFGQFVYVPDDTPQIWRILRRIGDTAPIVRRLQERHPEFTPEMVDACIDGKICKYLLHQMKGEHFVFAVKACLEQMPGRLFRAKAKLHDRSYEQLPYVILWQLIEIDTAVGRAISSNSTRVHIAHCLHLMIEQLGSHLQMQETFLYSCFLREDGRSSTHEVRCTSTVLNALIKIGFDFKQHVKTLKEKKLKICPILLKALTNRKLLS